MLQVKQTLKGRISGKSNLKGKLNNAIEYVYPDLEDLVVTPTGQDQHFKSEEYGYDNVTVKAVESEELSIMPNTENQEYIGLYNKVSVPGAADLLPENIAEGKEIFGVKGSAKVADFVITDGSYLCYSGHRQEIAQQLVNMCGAITSTYNMFYLCNKLTNLDVSKLDTSLCTSMQYMFEECSNISELDVSNFDTSNVTNMTNMFKRCSSLTSLNVSNFDTSNVTSIHSMFSGCSKLTEIDVSNFDTSKVTDMGWLFHNLNNITELDVSNFDTSKVTDMSSMFRGLFKVTELDVSNFNTSNVKDMGYMFESLRGVIDLDLSNWDLGKVTNCGDMFSYVTKLVNFKSFKNLGKGYTQKSSNTYGYKLKFSNSNNLSHESLLDIITNGLYDLNLTYDVANGGTLYTQTLQLGSTNLAKLTADEIAIGTAKGWNIT